MVKAASNHGLDRKYKPWRRGKSHNAKGKKGSLKQQLRGLQRLLTKQQRGAEDDNHRSKELQQQMQELQSQINEKEKVEQEKNNARKSHGVRFLERQRLTRAWQAAAKLSNVAEREQEWRRIGLDMLYVAHYPLQVRYQPLFRKKERIILDGRNLARRAAARGKILRQARTLERVAWIPTQVYDSCPTEWSNESERETFGVVVPSSETDPVLNDNRFSSAAASNSHSAILQAAEAMDAELNAEEEGEKEIVEDSKVAQHTSAAAGEGTDDSSSEGIVSDDEDDSDNADPLGRGSSTREISKIPLGEAVKGDTSSKEINNQQPASKQPSLAEADVESSSSGSDSSSDSSSDDDSDSDDDGSNDGAQLEATEKSVGKSNKSLDDADEPNGPNQVADPDDDDDFLMAPDDSTETSDIFAQAKEHVPSVDQSRGDKSQGWATQRQRPGQFKKRRMRR